MPYAQICESKWPVDSNNQLYNNLKDRNKIKTKSTL